MSASFVIPMNWNHLVWWLLLCRNSKFAEDFLSAIVFYIHMNSASILKNTLYLAKLITVSYSNAEVAIAFSKR